MEIRYRPTTYAAAIVVLIATLILANGIRSESFRGYLADQAALVTSDPDSGSDPGSGAGAEPADGADPELTTAEVVESFRR